MTRFLLFPTTWFCPQRWMKGAENFIPALSVTICLCCHSLLCIDTSTKKKHTHTHSNTSKSSACQAAQQLFKQLIRSGSSFGPAGGGLCKMVRSDTVTSRRFGLAWLAGVGPKPMNGMNDLSISWTHDWNPEHQVQAVWAGCHVSLWYFTPRREDDHEQSLWAVGLDFVFFYRPADKPLNQQFWCQEINTNHSRSSVQEFPGMLV